MHTYEFSGEVSISATIIATDEASARRELLHRMNTALAAYQTDSLYISDEPEWIEVEEFDAAE